MHEIQVYWNLREQNTNHVGRARGSISEATSLSFRGSRASSPPSSTAHWSQFWHPNMRSATAVDPGAETRGVFQRTTQTPRPIINVCCVPVSEQFVVVRSGTCWQPSTVGWISSHFWSSIIQGRQNPGAYSRGHHAFHSFGNEIGRVRVGLYHLLGGSFEFLKNRMFQFFEKQFRTKRMARVPVLQKPQRTPGSFHYITDKEPAVLWLTLCLILFCPSYKTFENHGHKLIIWTFWEPVRHWVDNQQVSVPHSKNCPNTCFV